MFDGFVLDHIDVGAVTLRVRYGGAGPAVVLLHGHPHTHVTWHKVAPALAERFTVVCPDLRGYGRSTVPPDEPEHAQMSKRAMAGDVVALMRALGHREFAVVGHDRGSYAAFRLAMDHPGLVRALVNIGGPPIGEVLDRAGETFARLWWHWFFLGQTDKPAEPLINRDPDAWYADKPDRVSPEAREDYRAARRDPATVHAMCEDYRAGLTVDRRHDAADKAAGRKVACPVLVLWGARDDLPLLYGGDPAAPWRTWADQVEGREVDAGHSVQEDAPGALVALLVPFLTSHLA
ncbi:alpha/beta hydrolase [Bailinhaonella thermotolerans]|uniref:Alpha/beta hydrolase n=2 Tax=Bailinhaonella thermotolerans TaxID=1070861 RepID=A0A3A4AAF9_9ACTN|nr:alpha/beta hydrolase [Bailinhaonella thermotolerans]RJL23030.1 alpha/beta hydrolase [Bailinhaonella thermotolerans]